MSIDLRSLKSMSKELHVESQKLAATLDQLQAAYRRIGPIRTKATNSLRDVPALTGPVTLPRLAQAKSYMKNAPSLAADKLHTMTESMQRMMGASAAEYLPTVEDVTSGVRSTAQAMRDTAKSTRGGGHILMPPGGATAKFKEIGVDNKGNALAQKATNIITGLHEGYERAVRTPNPVYSHLSPEVLLKEHNLLAGLTGKGATEGRASFQNLREISGEGMTHGSGILARYGEKAAPYAVFGEGKKLPKAMRKDILRNYGDVTRGAASRVTSDLDKLSAASEKKPAPSPAKVLGHTLLGLGTGMGAGYLGMKGADKLLQATRGHGLTPGGAAAVAPFVGGALGMAVPLMHHGVLERMREAHLRRQEEQRDRQNG